MWFAENYLIVNNKDLPLTNRVYGPFCKLPAELFPLGFMAQARSARAINPSEKTRVVASSGY